MGRTVANARAAGSLPTTVLAAVFLSVCSAGCNNSCVGFFSNPSGGTLSVNIDTCTPKDQDNGNVRLRFGPPPDSVDAWRKAGIQHAYLTIREVDARLKPDSAQDSSEWYDLAPKLKQQPLQIDLLAETNSASSLNAIDAVTLPAGVYSQIRIFLASSEASADVSVPEDNACATGPLNCVRTRDGILHSLALPAGPILIVADQPAGAVLYVLPNTTTNLDLQFAPDASQIYTAGQVAWFDPHFRTRWTFSSASTDPGVAVLPQ